ncbi:L-2-aminoadipate N-acetyltransferase [Ignicoccus islandicus DSM 13165]|uniref:L-2-aminoadipate N-acetyltransferase n=1 Tax=Ignicoccus islandicus DSM 13165 TaxID=940295 RepID=A0A0U2VBR0_9CREN|nr:lysine biosynthesis protein LysX [Ignicoccus islandicus]ALU11538.1 L-2-aminoadipate N-acetyltransferase [Ignicoccus islandicus DSM 13165]
MKVALAFDHPRWEEKHILEVITSMGYKAVPIPLRSTSLDLSKPKLDANVVIQRAISSVRAITSTSYFAAAGVPVVNSLFTQLICDNKVLTDMALSRAGVPRPRTIVAYSEEEAMKAAEELGYPVVVKPIQGSWGRLQALAKDPDTLLTVLEFREAMPSPQFKVHYIQEFVKKPNRDIRAFVVGGSVRTAIYRISSNWRTNTALGGKAEPAKIDSELEEIVLRAAGAVGGGVLGVDVVEDPERGYLVLEVNSNVDFKNTYRVTGHDLAKDIVEYAVNLAKM